MRDIEINLTGNPGDMAYKMPWSLDATCYNFIKPKTVYKADKEFELCKLGVAKDIRSLVIRACLKNYDYIAQMTELEQLYIYDARFLSKLDFLENLTKLRHLCICKSYVSSLDGLEKMLKNKRDCYEAEKEDVDAGRLYGVEGIYIHSMRTLDAFRLYDSGVPIGELSLYCKRRNLHWD